MNHNSAPSTPVETSFFNENENFNFNEDNNNDDNNIQLNNLLNSDQEELGDSNMVTSAINNGNFSDGSDSSLINLFKNRRNRKNRRKYSSDCLRKKLKHLVLKYFLELINAKIKGKNNKIKNIEDTQVKNTNLKFEKKFMYKSLGDIFSTRISNKFTKTINDPKDHNKKLIFELRSKNEVINNILKIKFIECLNHFIGKKILDELEGMKTLKEIQLKDEKDKIHLNYYAFRYEENVIRTRPRKRKIKDKPKPVINMNNNNS